MIPPKNCYFPGVDYTILRSQSNLVQLRDLLNQNDPASHLVPAKGDHINRPLAKITIKDNTN